MSKYKVGNVITGCVTGIEKYGIFVGLDEYYSGLVHISEISDGFVKDVADYVKLGETILVKVIDVNDDECHVKLSIKDIDYRIEDKKLKKIEETGSGFQILKDHLDSWMEEKTTEINKKLQNMKKN